MSKRKVYDLNASSGLGIGIELSKLQDKRRKEKTIYENTGKKVSRKPLDKSVWVQKNKGLENRAKFDQSYRPNASTIDEQDALLESQKSLERKSRIYERMVKEGKEFDDMDDNQLVDFEQKKWETPTSSNKANHINDKKDPWVEYVDDFGRTRLVRQSELKQYQDSEGSSSPGPSPEDAAVQQERLDWEMKREEERKGPMFYDADKEHRTRGVGFYKFSGKEEERRAQMEELKKIREETDQRRALHQSIRDKRKEKLQQRLNIIRENLAQRDPKAYFPPLDQTKFKSNLPTEFQTSIDLFSFKREIISYQKDLIDKLKYADI